MRNKWLNMIWAIAFIFLNGRVSAQLFNKKKSDNKLEQDLSEIDTSYIKSYAEIFTLRVGLTNKKNEFEILEKNTEDNVKYAPNSSLNFGMGFSYKWAAVNLAFTLPGTNNDDETYGNTKRFDLQTNIYARKFIVDIVFQFYNGFYVANPTLINPGWVQGDPYPIRDDIKSFAMGFSGNYVFNNRKFSYRSAFTFNERQKKNAGSFTAGGGMLLFNLKSDTGLVPGELFPDSIVPINFDKVSLTSTYILGGYAYTFVIRNWYFTLSLGLGGGLSTSRSRTTNDIKAKSNPSFSIISDFRGAVGYNSDLIYVGLSWNTGAFAVNSSKDLLITYGLSKINFYVGYRFYKWFKSSRGMLRPNRVF